MDLAKRRYLCDLIGDGTEDDPYRPKIADCNVSWVANVETDPETGRPVYLRCEVEVDADEDMHAALLADPQIEAL